MSRKLGERIPDTYGAYIYEQRVERKWNQEQLAKRTGFSKSWISALERNTSNGSTIGNAPRPEPDTIDRISDALGVDSDVWRLRLGYGPRYATHEEGEQDGNTIIISQNKLGHVKLSGTPPPQERLLDTVQTLREEAEIYQTAAARLLQTANELEKCL